MIGEAFRGYAHPVAALTPPYASGLPEGLQPYAPDPATAKRLLDESGWPSDRALRVAARENLRGVADLLAADFESALGIKVKTSIIAPEDVAAAERRLVEKVIPLDFNVLVHAWFELASDAPPAVVHREFFHSTGAFRAAPPIAALAVFLCAARRRCTRSTTMSSSPATPPRSSSPRRRSTTSTGRAADG